MSNAHALARYAAACQDEVTDAQLRGRDLIEPVDGLAAWTDARWRRAHRRGAAFALIDQIHARSVGVRGVEHPAGAQVGGRHRLGPRTVSPGLLGHHRRASTAG